MQAIDESRRHTFVQIKGVNLQDLFQQESNPFSKTSKKLSAISVYSHTHHVVNWQYAEKLSLKCEPAQVSFKDFRYC